MTLAFDIGNSATKVALFKGYRLLRAQRLPTLSISALTEFLAGAACDATGVCSVVPARNTVVLALLAEMVLPRPVEICAASPLPFKIAYETPDTLGSDRLAAAAGASALLDKADSFITLDAGTAVTVEVVMNGVFLGGSIGPGPRLMGRALADGTAQLPDVEAAMPPKAIGRTTADAIRAGVMIPFIDGTSGLLDRVVAEVGADVPVLATGGWAPFLAEYLPRIGRVEPHLVLHGVNAIVAADYG